MTTRPSMPPEVQDAYDRGEVVTWSPVRGAWTLPGRRRTEVVAMRRRMKNTGPEKQRAVAAALEDLSPRAVRTERPRREVPQRCPRCNGSVIRATDEQGDPDDHCMACGARVGAPTAEQAEALRREIDRRELNSTGKRSRRPHVSNGVKL